MDVLPHQSTSTPSTFVLAIVDAQDDRVSIRAAGELDVAATDDLSRMLTSEIAAGHVFVRIDLSAVTSLDSSCLGALAQAYDGCLASQGFLLIEGLGDGARRVLTATGLDRSLFLTRTTGPQDWLPNLPRLAYLVLRECRARTN